MIQRSPALLIVISGPSGVGKTTLEKRLIKARPDMRVSVSTTTRRPREGEVTGEDYFFVNRDVFEEMKDRELIEWAEVHGEYYGTPRRFVENELTQGCDVLLNIDVQGGISVKKVFPDAVTIFILPPSFEDLKLRIQKRGNDESLDLDLRLANAREELKASDNYDYFVVNGDLDTAAGEILAIITAERCRRERLGDGFIEDFT